MWSRTASRVRPGTPHQTRRPSELRRPRGTTPLSEATWSAWRRSKYIVHRSWLSAAYLCSFRCASGSDERMRAISARRSGSMGTGGTGTPPALSLHELLRQGMYRGHYILDTLRFPAISEEEEEEENKEGALSKFSRSKQHRQWYLHPRSTVVWYKQQHIRRAATGS